MGGWRRRPHCTPHQLKVHGEILCCWQSFCLLLQNCELLLRGGGRERMFYRFRKQWHNIVLYVDTEHQSKLCIQESTSFPVLFLLLECRRNW